MFPYTPKDIMVEIYVNAAWVDITDYVDTHRGGALDMERGTPDWANVANPGKITLYLNNADGRFSPHNPTGPYFGSIGRNTPIRVMDVAADEHRFQGYIDRLPQRWNARATDKWTQVEAHGIFHMLNTGVPVLRSSMRREIPRKMPSLRAYWPLEDEDRGQSRLASGITGGSQLRIVSDDRPNLAAFDEFDCSKPILIMNNADIRGDIEPYGITGELQVQFLLSVQSTSVSGQTMLHIRTTGTCKRWEIQYLTTNGGSFRIRAISNKDVEIGNSGSRGSGLDNGRLVYCGLRLIKNTGTGDIDWLFNVQDVGELGGVTHTGSVTGNFSLGQADRVNINYAGGHTDVAIGHVTVSSQQFTFLTMRQQVNAYNLERAGRRIERLLDEQAYPFLSIGNLDKTQIMGPQRVGTLFNLLTECAKSDGGILFEPPCGCTGDLSGPDAGIGYRTLESLWNQPAKITLGAQTGQLSPDLEPDEDDAHLRNDITATNPKGATAQKELRTGRLNVNPPFHGTNPGVGRIEDQIDVNVPEDHLPHRAGWHLHISTVEDLRYPVITIDMSTPSIADNVLLVEAILQAEFGDRLVITGPPSNVVPPEDISQLIIGVSEELDIANQIIRFNCVPEEPYKVGKYNSTTQRAATPGSQLNEALDTTEVGVDVTNTKGIPWTTKAASFPFDIWIGGERMTVTGATTPVGTSQTLTVTRSVNGIVKGHAIGAPVNVFRPVRYVP